MALSQERAELCDYWLKPSWVTPYAPYSLIGFYMLYRVLNYYSKSRKLSVKSSCHSLLMSAQTFNLSSAKSGLAEEGYPHIHCLLEVQRLEAYRNLYLVQSSPLT